MSTLIESCSQLLTGLQNAKLANQTRQELSALQQRKREWEQHASERFELLNKARLVDANLLRTEEIAKADASVQALALEAKKVLQDGGNVQDLSKDSLWTKLTKAAGSANILLRDVAKTQWQQFVQSLGHVDTPQVLEGRMLKTPANEVLLNTYKQQYLMFQAAVRAELPISNTTRTDLATTVETLQGLSEQLQGTAPDSVRKFLKAIGSGGADLELLTPEVMEWLRENDTPSRFVIKSRMALR
jgi:hypothetical protein